MKRLLRILLIAVIAGGVSFFTAKHKSGIKDPAAFAQETRAMGQWSNSLQSAYINLTTIYTGQEFQSLMILLEDEALSVDSADFIQTYNAWKSYSHDTMATGLTAIKAAETIPNISNAKMKSAMTSQQRDLQGLYKKFAGLNERTEAIFDKAIAGQDMDYDAMLDMQFQASIELIRAENASLKTSLLYIESDHPNYSLLNGIIASNNIVIADLTLSNLAPDESDQKQPYTDVIKTELEAWQSSIDKGLKDTEIMLAKTNRQISKVKDPRQKQVMKPIRDIVASYVPAFDVEKSLLALEQRRLEIFNTSDNIGSSQTLRDELDRNATVLTEERMLLQYERSEILANMQ